MPDAEEKDKAQFRQYIDNRIDGIVAKHLEQLGRELDARIDCVSDLLSQRLMSVEAELIQISPGDGTTHRQRAAIEDLHRRLAALESQRLATSNWSAHQRFEQMAGELDQHKRVIDGLRAWFALPGGASAEVVAEMVKEKSLFFVRRDEQEVQEAFRRLVEWFAIPGAESIRAGRLAAMMMGQVADLRAENARLHKELDELLGSEFFKVGERLRRANFAEDAEIARLVALLGDPRATGQGVAEFLDRVETELVAGRAGAIYKFSAGLLDSGAQSYFADRYGHTVEHLLRWLHEVRNAAEKHINPTSTGD